MQAEVESVLVADLGGEEGRGYTSISQDDLFETSAVVTLPAKPR